MNPANVPSRSAGHWTPGLSLARSASIFLSSVIGRDAATQAPKGYVPASRQGTDAKLNSDARSAPGATLTAALRDLLDYDAATGIFTWKSRGTSSSARPWANKIWNARFAGKRAGSIRHGYEYIGIDGVSYASHRLAWVFVHGKEPDGEIDHISHDKTDNRIANLRDVSNAENQRNKPLFKTNTSGVAGVRWCRDRQRWIALISVNGKRINLGRFDTAEEAVAARRAAETHHGFHANHGKAS